MGIVSGSFSSSEYQQNPKEHAEQVCTACSKDTRRTPFYRKWWLWKGMGACMNSKESKKNPVAAFFGAIGKFFKEFGEAAAKGDGAVKACYS